MTKILHYLNQFFGGIGGEDKAGQDVVFRPHAVGIGAEIERSLPAHGVDYATLICGDNYFHEQENAALDAMGAAIDKFKPDFFIAGPAFNAGRYGIACAKVCSWVRDYWQIPTITGMHESNPGTQEIGRQVFVLQTGASTAAMAETLKRISSLLELVIKKDNKATEDFRAEHCLSIPRRFTVRTHKADYARAVDVMMAKLAGQPYEGEIPQFKSEAHKVPNLTGSLKDATIALVTEGGLVPRGNPDRLESSRGSRYFKYSVAGIDDLKAGQYQAMHTGYDTSTVDQDPDRIVPLDAMRALEKSQRFKTLHDQYYVTTGTGAMPSKMAELGAGIAGELVSSGVNAVILTAT
ncbi:MAG: glycine/betaine/sarcosine/D-proline family reductase selenoprotein B [Deltaproteobacteria bacterium]|nr:glycine/betaine/sarcosine/D-proline family reductase selenoprotein B [Deltaproteobacteria bacterium]